MDIPVHEMASKAVIKPPYSDVDFKALSVDQEWVTPERAKMLRQTCHYDRQRRLSMEHIRRLASEMRNGWFLPGTPIWFCVMPDESMLIVNGNHTLEAVVDSGVSLPLTFVYQQVQTLEDVAKAYACFDIQRMRTWMQAAEAAGLAEDVPLAKNVLAALTHVIGDFNSDARHNPHLRSRPVRFRLMEEYKVAASLLHSCLAGAPPVNTKYVRRSGVMAVALATVRYQPSSAETFWRDMVWDDGLRKDDPRKVLLRYLQQHDTTGTTATRENIIAAANCWNAAFENRTLDHVKPGNTTRVVILGTPWSNPPAPRKTAENTKRGKIIVGKRVSGTGEMEHVASYAKGTP
jgi:hypothetical protein